jgi:hypothetical protein
MEAAALFTIARVREVDIAAVFTISDHLLIDTAWQRAPETHVLAEGLARILDASLRVLHPYGRFDVQPIVRGNDEVESPFA